LKEKRVKKKARKEGQRRGRDGRGNLLILLNV
jgi:hypothetical protein